MVTTEGSNAVHVASANNIHVHTFSTLLSSLALVNTFKVGSLPANA